MLILLLSLALSLPCHPLPASPLLGVDSGTDVEASQGPERIAWFTDWDQARAEAERTGRPIFLMSAAPRCHDVPGLW